MTIELNVGDVYVFDSFEKDGRTGEPKKGYMLVGGVNCGVAKVTFYGSKMYPGGIKLSDRTCFSPDPGVRRLKVEDLMRRMETEGFVLLEGEMLSRFKKLNSRTLKSLGITVDATVEAAV